ncbi:MAG TPA: hypothetical protein VFQ23_05280 [Anaerolineales bacterium]|nr:hypothetical protein [Anaerolineales bacterium]
MKKYSKEDQKLMATWAADCAERVLPFFEEAYPEDDRPRKALETCRTWVRTGVFKMAEIRGASLSSHAAARDVKDNDPALFAARAAGQAVATAHVAQHGYGGALYALKAIAAKDPANAERNVAEERDWQARHLPKHLREEIMSRIVVEKRRKGIFVKLIKDENY